MQGKWLLAAGAALILGLGGLALWRLQSSPAPVPVPVAAAPTPAAGPQTNPNEISLSGRVQPQKVVPVPAPVDGVLENLTVREGEEVAEGQLLARVKNDNLDTEQTQQEQEVSRLQSKVTSLEASIIAARLEAQRTKSEAENSRASLEIMRKGFERQTLLRKEGATPRLAFEKAEREFKNAQAETDARGSQERQAQDNYERLTKQLDEARRSLAAQSEEWERSKADLNSAEIHAPATGILAKVNKQNGDAISAAADKELFLIGVDLSALEVVVELTPDELKRVKPGMPASVSLVENNNEPLPGVLKEIQETSGYIEFASPNPAVVPGLIAQVRILLNGTLVPVTPPAPPPPVKPTGAPVKKK